MSSDLYGRTRRLELADQNLRSFEAVVLASSPDGIVLSTSAFYPGGGGQPADRGVFLWQGVETHIGGVRKGDDLYLIPVEDDPIPPPGTTVRAAVADERRSALMRTHSALHVLCGVVFRDFGGLVTGGNMEGLTARMDFNLPEVPPGFKEAVEEACNAEVTADRRIDVSDPAPRGGVRDPRHHPYRDEPRARDGGGGPDHRHRRPGQPGRRRHPRRLHQQIGRMRVAKVESKGKGFRRLRIEVAD